MTSIYQNVKITALITQYAVVQGKPFQYSCSVSCPAITPDETDKLLILDPLQLWSFVNSVLQTIENK